jgi:hypothetical protein
MPADRPRPGAPLARRRFLGALALAPAALAGCAASGAAGSRPPAAAGAPAAGPSAAGPSASGPPRVAAPDATIAAVREHPLSPDAEPAFVFRAGAARPGEP